MSERRGVTFERLARMKREYADDDDVLDVVAATEHLANRVSDLEAVVRRVLEADRNGQSEAFDEAVRDLRSVWAKA